MTRLDERFADWVDGRLRPAEREALEAELAADPALQREAEEYRRTVQLLRGALAPEEMGASIADSVMAEVGEVARRPLDRRPPRNWRPFLASLVAAAAFILVFAVLRLIPPASPGTDAEPLAKAAADDEDLVSPEHLQRTVPAADKQNAPGNAHLIEGPEPLVKEEQKPAVVISLPDGSVGSSRPAAPVTQAGQPAEEPSPERTASPSKPVGELDKSAASQDLAPADPARSLRLEEAEESREEKRKALGTFGSLPSPQPQGGEKSDARTPEDLGLGDLAIVVQVEAAVAARVRADLERRSTALSAAELLAAFAPPMESDARGGGGGVDFRGIPVQMLDNLSVRAEPEPQTRDRVDAELLNWGELAPSDRVLVLRGNSEQLRSFSTMLQGRLSPPVGSLSYRRIGGSLTTAGGEASRQRFAETARPPAPGAGRAAPGPSTPGPAGPAVKVTTGSPDGDAPAKPRGAAGGGGQKPAGGDQLSLYLVLRFPR